MNAAPTFSPPSVHSPTHTPMPVRTPRVTGRSHRWISIGLKLGLFVALAVLAILFRNPLLAMFKPPPPVATLQRQEIVTLTDSRNIRVAADSPLAARLRIAAVQKTTVDLPMLSVTGSIIARL